MVEGGGFKFGVDMSRWGYREEGKGGGEGWELGWDLLKPKRDVNIIAT